jgi:hypothetical protein
VTPLLLSLVVLAGAPDPCPGDTPAGRWRKLPKAPEHSKAAIHSAHGFHSTTSWWKDGELHVVRGKKHTFLDVCAKQWRDAPDWKHRGGRPQLDSSEAKLDTVYGRGPAMPSGAGQVRYVAGGRLIPRSFVPRPYFGVHGFDDATLVLGDRKIKLPKEGAPTARRPYTYVVVREGDRMVIFGGHGEQGWQNDGAVFHLPRGDAPGRWEKIPPTTVPDGELQVLATALVGDRFFVWSERFAKVLDLAHMSWRDMSTDGAPALRKGGSHNLAVVRHAGKVAVLPRPGHQKPKLESGAIYDVTEDRWTPVKGVGGRLAWALDDKRVLVVSNHTTFQGVILDMSRGRAHKLFGPPNANREKLAVHFSGERLFVFGGITKKMTSKGGGCEGHTGPQGCDPVPPTYKVKQHLDGWVLRP